MASTLTSTLTAPQAIDDFLLFRMHRVLAHGGGTIRRLCEGQLGITWREWRLIASLKPGVALDRLPQAGRRDVVV